MNIPKKKLKEEKLFLKNNSETRIIPSCAVCGKELIEAVDSITGTKTGYVWKFNCKCVPENIRMCIG